MTRGKRDGSTPCFLQSSTYGYSLETANSRGELEAPFIAVDLIAAEITGYVRSRCVEGLANRLKGDRSKS